MMKWINLTQEGEVPLPRSSHSISAISNGDSSTLENTNLVFWGGENAPRLPVTRDISIFNMGTHAWSTVAATTDSPSLRVAHAAASVGNNVYIHGGRTEVGEDSTLGDFHVFDAEKLKWTEVHPAGTCPPARNYHSATSDGDVVYIFGGCGGALPSGATKRLADLWRYDTRAGVWEELPTSDAIKGRGGPGFVALNGNLYVIGGFTGQEAADIHQFNVATNTWQQLTVENSNSLQPKFTPRSVFGRGGHSCSSSGDSGGTPCGHDGHILVFGGEIDPSDLGHAGAGQFSNSTFCLDPTAATGPKWHPIEIRGDGEEGEQQQPGPRGWGASTEIPGRGIIVSGGIDDDNVRLGDLYFLDYHHQ